MVAQIPQTKPPKNPFIKGANCHELMRFDPASGLPNPYPSEVNQYRKYHGNVAWLFNPYTGNKRSALDIGSDTFGCLIVDS